MKEENDWSVLRRAVQRGYDLAYHRALGTDYETLSAQMDVAANDLAPLLRATPNAGGRNEAELQRMEREIEAKIRNIAGGHVEGDITDMLIDDVLESIADYGCVSRRAPTGRADGSK